ncbi:hypothetical protein GPJ56_007291 [Histomonas meleagridis]|uniref:uncharacterized protein n=1 Tax=Histomonas meleagridis TaxID=135588 RepID=UPI00355A180B|nr:hypothetical protein GPJ56_007291 [Histomonas meleagridis]KAH0804137.1 hypothetical protein GO595_002967 [Histomonas meleagridis]
MLNFTLSGLLISSLSNSPFVSVSSSSYKQHKLQVIDSIFRNHFSNFLYISSNSFSSIVKKSQFTGFLSSCIEIENSERIESESSFSVIDTVFSDNKTPFNGGSIKVSVDSTVNVNITNCEFSNNQAGIGGGIYILSLGSLNMTNNMFKYNSANTGSHAFISIPSCLSNNDIFEYSIGTDSSISFVSHRDVTYVVSINGMNYFQNNATINFMRMTSCDISFTNCNFMKFSETNVTNYQSEYFFDNTTTASAEFANCQFNQYYISRTTTIIIGELTNYLTGSAMLTNAEEIRLVPTESPTVPNDWTSGPAIFAVTCFVFFFVVSVIGIIIVSCTNKSYGKPLALEEDSSEKYKN